jgi:hypothetical protein
MLNAKHTLCVYKYIIYVCIIIITLINTIQNIKVYTTRTTIKKSNKTKYKLKVNFLLHLVHIYAIIIILPQQNDYYYYTHIFINNKYFVVAFSFGFDIFYYVFIYIFMLIFLFNFILYLVSVILFFY